MNTDYNLNFTIPQGPTGSTGPTGPTGSPGPTGPSDIKAYGGIYSNISVSLDINDTTTPYYLSLPSQMPALNVTYDNTQAVILRIQQGGTYEITYGCVYIARNVPYKSVKICSLSVYSNNIEIPGSTIQDFAINSIDDTNQAVFGSMNNTVVSKLNAGDGLTLMFGSTTPGSVSFQPNGVNAMLIVKKIDD